ncbi:cysteine-rich venom protein Mr30-like isoform X2 [Mytilus californianus]|uniref:cysteine-rich venom protein Mr30-like isoform X1 n=1 Tax=Mytilus californianus TaxID=6549 RepID=UPI0022452025|nr:cysteine-rich venom protein Mr30-like isoform X1 [Mytilus californianus]XP_052093282.1 cysteine-rich venom protein Mr30-like isoform X2 [Mytilus californianus]
MYPSHLYIYMFVIFGSSLSGQSFVENETFTNQLYRRKRSVNCESSNTLKKYNFYSGHTACLTASSSADLATSGVTADEKTEIVNKHNTLRSLTQATNMMKMSWDDETAYIAQKWAENCVTSHESPGLKRSIPGRFGLGQNLFWGSRKYAWSEAIQSWYDEISDFTFNGQNVFSKIGHYTQVVWADSIKLGCGYAHCTTTRIHLYVCNYGPAGNIGDTSKPYKQGTPCQDCPGNCANKLCDCDKVCLNGGSLDLSTCTCNCKSGYSGPDCSLNCATKTDPGYCGTQYPPSYCATFSNVPSDCPHMCQICPNCDIVCLNGGSLDLSTCTCNCKSGYGGPDCSLNCATMPDPGYCGTQFPPSYCETFSNVPSDCPHMCKICLNGGVAVTGPSDGISSTSTIKTSEPVTIPSRSTSPGKTDTSQSTTAVTETTNPAKSDSSRNSSVLMCNLLIWSSIAIVTMLNIL